MTWKGARICARYVEINTLLHLYATFTNSILEIGISISNFRQCWLSYCTAKSIKWLKEVNLFNLIQFSWYTLIFFLWIKTIRFVSQHYSVKGTTAAHRNEHKLKNNALCRWMEKMSTFFNGKLHAYLTMFETN